MWLELLLLLLLLGYLYHLWAFSYWKRRGVMQVDPEFIFGHMKDIFFKRKTIQQVFSDIYTKHKKHKLVGLYSFYRPILLVTDPELVRQVIVKDFNSFSGAAAEIDIKVDPIAGINPFFTTDVEEWKERRGVHVTMQTPSKLKSSSGVLLSIGQSMIKYINDRKGQPVKVRDVTEYYAIDAVCSTAFGYEPTAFTNPENAFLKHARDNLLDPNNDAAMSSSMFYPIYTKLLRIRLITLECQEFFTSMAMRMVDFREKNPSNKNDLIDILMKTSKKRISEGKKGLTPLEIAGHSMTAYVDSFFTTSSMLGSVIINLALNPDIQEKLREEIMSAGKEPEDFDYDKINTLKYLQMTINEALRLNLPFPVTGRVCVKSTELGGLKVEKGTKVVLPYLLMHLDPDYWPEPEKYNPERFSDEDSIVKGTFLPFGDGPKMCLGSRYALFVMKTALIYILLKFKMSQVKKPEVRNKDIAFQFNDDTTIVFEPINVNSHNE